MDDNTQISFGDNVRIISTPVTQAAGLAGLLGNVHGVTTPSVTGVDIIGQTVEDVAFNVSFEDRQEEFWFAADLLEFVDHAPGAEIRLTGISTKWVRAESGEWEEFDLETQQTNLLQRIIGQFRKRG
jgi:hypothetical protein